MNYVIPIFSGIGNVIQSLLFANYLKDRYGKVYGYFKGPDFPIESRAICNKIFTEIYSARGRVPANFKILKVPVRRNYAEWLCWFKDNGFHKKEAVNRKIRGINYIPSKKKYKVVVCPETKKNWLCKQYPHWVKLIHLLAEYADEFVAVIGLDKSPVLSYADDYRGRISLLEAGGIIKNADIFVGVESGVAHYSAALGTKTFIIYGGTNPTKNMPPSNGIRIAKNLDCQPCQHHKNKGKPKQELIGCDDRKCMNDFSPEEVMEQICQK